MGRTGRRMTGPGAAGPRVGTEPEVPPSRAGDAWSADGADTNPGASTRMGAAVRAADGPIMTGDVLDGRRVIGFGCAAQAVPTSADDRLLLEGDEHSGPPSRSTDPARHPALERVGLHPYAQLERDRVHHGARGRVHHADDLVPGLTEAFDELIHGGRGPRFLAPLIDRFATSGHGFWLVGGAPRDLLSGFRPDEVGDLDATGTAPAGAFCDLADDVLERDGSSAECPGGSAPTAWSAPSSRRNATATSWTTGASVCEGCPTPPPVRTWTRTAGSATSPSTPCYTTRCTRSSWTHSGGRSGTYPIEAGAPPTRPRRCVGKP